MSTVIVCFIFPQSSWYRGIDTEFMKHFILLSLIPRVSNPNFCKGYVENINYTMVGSGGSYGQSRDWIPSLKTFKFKFIQILVQNQHCEVNKQSKATFSSLYAHW
jgi:hypothetical protein